MSEKRNDDSAAPVGIVPPSRSSTGTEIPALSAAEEPENGMPSRPLRADILKLLRAYVVSHGECHSENCGDDPSLPRAERLAFMQAHEDICTCGAEQAYAVAIGEVEAPVARAEEAITAKCLDCGLDYSEFGLDVTLPHVQWREIHPDNDGLLCANCICKRAGMLEGAVAIRAFIDAVPLKPHTCGGCGHLRKFDATKEYCNCPVVNIRIHETQLDEFGCTLWESNNAAKQSERLPASVTSRSSTREAAALALREGRRKENDAENPAPSGGRRIRNAATGRAD